MSETDPTTLHQHEGRPVPWVTRWTGERVRTPYGVDVTRDGALRVSYKEGPETREASGILWQREGLSRSGRPDWASVNTYRQRACMVHRKCQVCGQKITDKPIRWLMPLSGLEHLDDGVVISQQPPTCSACIPLALDMCPNLQREGYQILKVIDYSIWGVTGEVVTAIDGQMRRMIAAIQYGNAEQYGEGFSYTQVFAKQQVVQLGKYVVEEVHQP